MSDAKPTDPATALNRLLGIMARLRDPETGCPWDIQQTMQSLTRYTVEETYEAVDAIERNNPQEIKDELGDVLFQIVFYAQIGQEQGSFDFADIANAISDKMIRRHPHVFADKQVDEQQLSAQWETIKASESASTRHNLLDSVPTGLPALMYAQKIQKKCARVGFDWPDIPPVMDKVHEELAEIQQELDAQPVDQQALEDEIGDALFAMVNLARHCQVDADAALRRASLKFRTRFDIVEQLARQSGKKLADYSLDELEAFWCKAKSISSD